MPYSACRLTTPSTIGVGVCVMVFWTFNRPSGTVAGRGHRIDVDHGQFAQIVDSRTDAMIDPMPLALLYRGPFYPVLWITSGLPRWRNLIYRQVHCGLPTSVTMIKSLMVKPKLDVFW